jgi:hypothetical protein
MVILKRLRVREVKSMSLSFYHVHSRACDLRSNEFLAVFDKKIMGLAF